MRSNHLRLFPCLLVAIMGCKDNLEAVPETPPPAQGPGVPPDAALRPFYQEGGKPPAAAGTAFVVEDKAGRRYMLTAAHIMDDEAEWKRVQAVSLRVLGGSPVAQVHGQPLYIGKAFDVADASVDLVIWPLAEGARVSPLKLAAADAKKNEWVWAVGQEPGSSGPQKMYRCQVTGTDTGGLLLRQHDRFEMRGFSGGPVVNARGEVVGSLLGGRAPTLIIARVSSLRERLAQASIQLP